MLKNNKIILAFMLGLALLLPMKVDAEPSYSNVYLFDEASILSSSEEEDIVEYLETLDDDINYLVITYDDSDFGSDTDEMLEAYYDAYFSKYDDGIAFAVDMYNREIYISGYGDIQYKITDADAYDITDNAYKFAAKEDYYNCIIKAMNQADTFVNKGFILRPMKYLVLMFLSLIIGYLFAFYKAMLQRANIKMTTSYEDMLLTGANIASGVTVYNTIKSRHSSSSSGGGGGSSGGGGGGGHSGGGHSF